MPALSASVPSADATSLADPREAAESAGLVYVSDDSAGFRREGEPPAFRYRKPDGKLVRDKATLDRLRALAIPPAWTDVWICTKASGHLQATGRDARGRKQYRYHPQFREVRETTKYEHMLDFARARCPPCAPDWRSTWHCADCRARRCWPPWCICWRPR